MIDSAIVYPTCILVGCICAAIGIVIGYIWGYTSGVLKGASL